MTLARGRLRRPRAIRRAKPGRLCSLPGRGGLVGLIGLIGTVGLSGCSSLPQWTSALAPVQAQAVQVNGSRGPLSPQRSQAILDRVGQGGERTEIFSRHVAREEAIVDSPLTAGNQVTLLQDGPATYQAMLAAIASARNHINMETYILDDDEVGQQFAQALMERRRAGVAVHLLYDSVGTFSTPQAFFQTLSEAGVQLLAFNPVIPANPREPIARDRTWSPNQRDHRKLLIVDGEVAFLGGINISSVYSGSAQLKRRKPEDPAPVAWRDTDLRLRGPVVAEFQKLFLTAWAEQSDTPIGPADYFPPLARVGSQLVRAIGSSPQEPYSQIYATLLSAIDSAETSIRLTNAYFAPDPQLLGALERAALRGVDVVLILPGQSDSWLVFHAGRSYYSRLLKAQVRVLERQGAILHAKTALIDGVWATVGSTNLDWRSFLHNHEINAVMLGADFGDQLAAMFARDEAASLPINSADWAQRGLQEHVKEWFARLWEYWL